MIYHSIKVFHVLLRACKHANHHSFASIWIFGDEGQTVGVDEGNCDFIFEQPFDDVWMLNFFLFESVLLRYPDLI